MRITYYGHSCFGISSNENDLLFDSFISPNELAKGINVDAISCNYMFISHGHKDHIADVEQIANRTKAKITSNYEIVSWFEDKGLTNGHPLNHGGSKKFDFEKAKYVNAVHSSSLPDITYGGNPGGFAINIEGKTIYYAGDTALSINMKLIGEYSKPDVAFLPIGDNFTMGIEDAVIANEFIQCSKIIGMHYDSFAPITINHEEAIAAFQAAGKELILMNIGSSIEL